MLPAGDHIYFIRSNQNIYLALACSPSGDLLLFQTLIKKEWEGWYVEKSGEEKVYFLSRGNYYLIRNEEGNLLTTTSHPSIQTGGWRFEGSKLPGEQTKPEITVDGGQTQGKEKEDSDWKNIPSNKTWRGVSWNGVHFWGVTTDEDVFYLKNGSWKQVPGKLTYISVEERMELFGELIQIMLCFAGMAEIGKGSLVLSSK